MNPCIRFATLADVPSMVQIYAPNIVDSHVSFETEVPSVADFSARVTSTLQKFPWLVYIRDGEVAGYSYASTLRPRRAYDWSAEVSVYVGHKFHGKQIGTHLYRQLFSLIRAQGIANVFGGMTEPNEGSSALHRSLGFRPVGIYKNVGFKLGRWWDVTWWQLELQHPAHPTPLISKPIYDQ